MASDGRSSEDGDVAGALTLERVRQDIDVLSRAGLDMATFLHEMDQSLQRAVPFRGSCVAIVDPASLLLTGTYKFGDLHGNDTKDQEWGLLEYGEVDETSFHDLCVREVPAVGMQLATNGDISCSPRMRELLRPHFGYGDELRLIARDARRPWGGLALFRDVGDDAFSAEEVAYAARCRAPSPSVCATGSWPVSARRPRARGRRARRS